MTKALSLDLRRRIVRYVATGHSRREAAVHFAVAPSCAIKLVSAHERTGRYAPKTGGGLAVLKTRSTLGLNRMSDALEIAGSEDAAAVFPAPVP